MSELRVLVFGWLWVWLAVALLLLVVDAVLPLGGGVRLVLGIGLLVLLFLIVLSGLKLVYRTGRTAPACYSRNLEEALGIHDNELTNAWQLRRLAETVVISGGGGVGVGVGEVTAKLAGRAVADGERVAGRVSLREVQRAGIAAGWGTQLRFGAVLTIILATAWWCPRLFAFGIPRWLDPLGDHPAFTWLEFSVMLTPAAGEIFSRDDVQIHVALQGRGADAVGEVALVWLADGAGLTGNVADSAELLPLQRLAVKSSTPAAAGSSRWEIELRDLRSSGLFFVQAGAARSALFELPVIQQPRILGYEVRQVAPQTVAGERRAAVVVADSASTIPVLRGGALEVQIESSLPITAVVNGLTGDSAALSTLAVERLGTKEVTVTIPVLTEGLQSYQLQIEAEAGQRGRESIDLVLKGVADAPPTVTVREPGGDGVALAGTRVVVAGAGVDDLGMVNGWLVATVRRNDNSIAEVDSSVGGGRLEAMAAKREQIGGGAGFSERWSAAWELDLEPLELQFGDVVEYFVEVVDGRSDSVGGGQFGRSAVFEIAILDAPRFNLLAGAAGTTAETAPREGESASERIKRAAAGEGESADESSSGEAGASVAGGATNTAGELGTRQMGEAEGGGDGDGGGDGGELITEVTAKTRMRDDLQKQFAGRLILRQSARLSDVIAASGVVNPAVAGSAEGGDGEREDLVYEFVKPGSAGSRSGMLVRPPAPNQAAVMRNAMPMPTSDALRKVPARYRDLVVAYFARVAELERTAVGAGGK